MTRKRVVALGLVGVALGFGAITWLWLNRPATARSILVAGLAGIVVAWLHGRARSDWLRRLALVGPLLGGAAIGAVAIHSVGLLAGMGPRLSAPGVIAVWLPVDAALVLCWGLAALAAAAMAERVGGRLRWLWGGVAAEWLVLALLAGLHAQRLMTWSFLDPQAPASSVGPVLLGGTAVLSAVGVLAVGVWMGLALRAGARFATWLVPVGVWLSVGGIGAGYLWARARVVPPAVMRVASLPDLPAGASTERATGLSGWNGVDGDWQAWESGRSARPVERRGCLHGVTPAWVWAPATTQVAALARLAKKALVAPGRCPLEMAVRPAGPVPGGFGWLRWVARVQWLASRTVELFPAAVPPSGARRMRLVPQCRLVGDAPDTDLIPWIFVDQTDGAATVQTLLRCQAELASRAHLAVVPGRWVTAADSAEGILR